MKAKMKLHKLLSMLLALVMVVGMIPAMSMTAYADGATPATETANFETDATAALALLNAHKTAGAEDSTWDASTKTLTLNGVNFVTTAATALKLDGFSTIVLNGENTITGGDSDSTDCYGIYSDSNLYIEGSGKLTVTAGNTTKANGNSYGIKSGTFIMDNSVGCDITAKGGTADFSYGIESGGMGVTITGGVFTAIGGTAIDSTGIFSAYLVDIQGGNVTAKGGSVNRYSSGICADVSLSVSGGNVTAEGGSGGIVSCGINCNLGISGGTVKATGEGRALNARIAPNLSSLSAYWWRISNSGPYYESSNYSYSWDEFGFEEYLEIRDTNPGNGNIVVVDAVNNIAVTVTAPELGATPDYNPVYTSTPENSVKIDTEYIKWYKIAEADFTGTDKDIWDSMGPNEKFTTGYYYYIDMYFYPNAGYKITTSTTGTVNGMHHDDPYYNLYQDNSEAFLSGLFVPLHEHVPGTEWKSDADNHWHICSVEGCGAVIESSKAAHIPDREAATETDPIKCTECDYIITAALGHTHGHTYEWVIDNEAAETGSFTVEAKQTTGDKDNPKTGDDSNMILWIVLLLASGLGVTGTVVYSKRKKYAK